MQSDERPAKAYTPCKELWCLTSYFNPRHYRTKRNNYERFAQPIRAAGIPLITVECAFADAAFDLPAAEDTLQIRCPDVMWQKERLLNLAMDQLPREAEKVAWLDADILFTNPNWAVFTAEMLNRLAFVQPFTLRRKYRAGNLEIDSEIGDLHSFAYGCAKNPGVLKHSGYFEHGSTGFAWAARRSIFKGIGLYDRMISGTADHLMAHAMLGDFDSPCIRSVFDLPLGTKLFLHNSRFKKRIKQFIPEILMNRIRNSPAVRNTNRQLLTHFIAWAEKLGQSAKGELGYIPGIVLHLWHGHNSDRAYRERHHELLRMGFDPERDLRIADCGCLEWARKRPELEAWARDMFAARHEDGRPRRKP